MKRREGYVEYIHSPLWQTKREMAFAALGRRCSKCKSTERLHVHHRTYERFGGWETLADLQVLCEKCHLALHERKKQRRRGKGVSKPEIGFAFRNKQRQKRKKKKAKGPEFQKRKPSKLIAQNEELHARQVRTKEVRARRSS